MINWETANWNVFNMVQWNESTPMLCKDQESQHDFLLMGKITDFEKAVTLCKAFRGTLPEIKNKAEIQYLINIIEPYGSKCKT